MAVANWGVLGCASIAEKTCRGMLEAGQKIVAVGSRSKEKAEAWSKEHAPGATPYGSYEEVLADANVQVVYIPLPTMMKKEWVCKAAAAGKHVLSEKPLAGSLEDTKEILDACSKAGVQYMDNTMFMHNQRLVQMKEAISAPSFGKIKNIVSSFSIPFGNDPEWASNIRLNKSTEPLGALGDLSWYNVRFSLWALDFETPEEVSCTFFESTSDGVPISLQATMRFSGGKYASFDSSFKSSLRQSAEVVGEKEHLIITDAFIPHEKSTASFGVYEGSIAPFAEFFPRDMKKEGKVTDCVQHAQLTKTMAELVTSGKVDNHWPEISLKTQQVLMACMASGEKNGAW
eukprot:CAMPEP_0206459242 /NCGR_PEP_ID=MMETSP0324_2-20121206/24062_1 /ASSEMBLY_ACC=CAM_ASM_000836 /TAXON_ID=2866 /ORGANISM="Crypthecodinium cohnii, Strain Seligo" /LENGTH=343 /DNA_ID=CAMNT_0053930761 /DNA_START=181 /DNA_END=1209 /DNA_ORIENTATION=-